MMQQNFKALLRENERVAGLFLNAACPELLEIAAYAGFQFVIIDNEHGSWDGATHAPMGSRGACPYVRANQFSAGDRTQYFDACNREQAVVMLIEGKEGLQAFDDIIAMDEVDCVFFGPCDMAVSLGHPGEDEHPEVIKAITDMIARAKSKGVYSGMMGFDGKNSRSWLDKGADYVCALSDVGLFYEVCKKTVDEIKE